MKAMFLALAMIVLGPIGALAVCPAHSPTFAATSTGGFRLCAPEVDADGDPVTAAFYGSCTVTVTWGAGKSAFVNLTSITPGTAQLVSFPAAKGAGTGVGFCTNADGIIGANVTSAITFRRGVPATPSLSQ